MLHPGTRLAISLQRIQQPRTVCTSSRIGMEKWWLNLENTRVATAALGCLAEHGPCVGHRPFRLQRRTGHYTLSSHVCTKQRADLECSARKRAIRFSPWRQHERKKGRIGGRSAFDGYAVFRAKPKPWHMEAQRSQVEVSCGAA